MDLAFESWTYPAVSVRPYPFSIGQIANETNCSVSSAIAPPPFSTSRRFPPVASLILLNTKESITCTPGMPQYSILRFAAMAPQNSLLLNAPDAFTLPMMPFLTDSHTAGTPTMMDGLKARISPGQLRTDWSVRVRGLLQAGVRQAPCALLQRRLRPRWRIRCSCA